MRSEDTRMQPIHDLHVGGQLQQSRGRQLREAEGFASERLGGLVNESKRLRSACIAVTEHRHVDLLQEDSAHKTAQALVAALVRLNKVYVLEQVPSRELEQMRSRIPANRGTHGHHSRWGEHRHASMRMSVCDWRVTHSAAAFEIR